jgi:hypothetical protein
MVYATNPEESLYLHYYVSIDLGICYFPVNQIEQDSHVEAETVSFMQSHENM